MSDKQISLRELRVSLGMGEVELYGWTNDETDAAVLALVEAVEAAAVAVPVSCCDQDFCPDPARGSCGLADRCVRIIALEKLARFCDFKDAA